MKTINVFAAVNCDLIMNYVWCIHFLFQQRVYLFLGANSVLLVEKPYQWEAGPASLSKINVGYFLGWFDDFAPPILKYIWHDGFDVIFGFRHLSFSLNILMNCFIKEICRCKRNLCKCWWTSLFVYEIQNFDSVCSKGPTVAPTLIASAWSENQ